MPLLQPINPVVVDSRAALWGAVADGLVTTADLTPDGKLRPSLTPTPAESVKELPFQMQTRPFAPLPPPKLPTPPTPPMAPMPPVVTREEVEFKILKGELALDDKKMKRILHALC